MKDGRTFMKEMWKEKKHIIVILLFAGYLIFNGIMLAGHELWRDEANVWLFARDASPLQLLQEIKYQGHPCLWYFIVMPFAKLRFPFQTICVLSFLVMAVAAGLFVYKAPFHPVTKGICLFSPIFSYYYSVVARNYCLIALLLILLVIFYPQRNRRPVIYGLMLGLLVQADTIALATAGLVSCMWLWEGAAKSLKEKRWQPLLQAGKGLWVPLLSLCFWILQFFRVSDSPEYNMRILSFGELISEMKYFGYHILNRMTGMGDTFSLALIVLFVMAGIFWSWKRRNFWPTIVMMGAFLFEVLFSVMVYQLHIWHYITLAFTLIWCFWMYLEQPEEESDSGAEKIAEKETAHMRQRKLGEWSIGRALPEIILIFLGVAMFMRWNSPEESSSLANAFNGLYSDGVHMAEYIAENISAEEVVFSTDVPEASTVQAYLGKEYAFYYAGSMEKATYAKYNEEQRQKISYDEFLQRIKEEFPDREYVYLLQSPANCLEHIPDEAKSKWELCYKTKEETARGEEYILYRIALQ